MRTSGKGVTLILIYIKFNVSPVGFEKKLTITLCFWTLYFIGNLGVFLYILVWMWLCIGSNGIEKHRNTVDTLSRI
jgi:hypothetical protein